MTIEIIQLDDHPLPEVAVSYSVEYQPADPGVGVFSGYHDVTAEVIAWSLGSLLLSRASLVAAMGEDDVAAVEERAAEAHARLLDAGDGPESDARFDTLQEAWARGRFPAVQHET